MKPQNAANSYLESRKPAFLFILLCFLVSKVASFDENIKFSFFNFTPNMTGIVYEGDACPSGNAIQLTFSLMKWDYGESDNVGRATYYEPMHLWHNSSTSGKIILADFNTQFSFAVDHSSKSSGHWGLYGFAFFLAPNGSSIPQNSGGGYLGLESNNSDIDCKFVAVEFDTYSDIWDPQSDHIAIDVDSVKNSSILVDWKWNDIEDGGRVNAFINYNSSTKNLSVILVDAEDSSGKNSSTLSATLDLSLYLPEWVTFGFSGTTRSSIKSHTIYSWNFSSTLQVPILISPPPTVAPAPTPAGAGAGAGAPGATNRSSNNSGRKSKPWATWIWVVLAIVVTIATLFVILGMVLFFYWRRKCCGMREDKTISVNVDMKMVTAPREFSYKELRLATSNFANEGLLGEGGFGKVYLGFLRVMNCSVAVKRITPNSQQGVKEYESEVTIITRLRHRNLVQLIGWCHDNKELLIVYEFLPNKNLDYHLHREPCLLTWDKRYKIAMGVASALFYLQEECDQCVLHRDIKPSNVLLDLSFNAKLGDFGLARLVDHGQGSRTTRVMLGTDGYIAPECLDTYKAIKESDIYSFGVVALEIASGKKVVTVIKSNRNKFKVKLVEWVWELYGKDSLSDAADPRLYGNYDTEQMERLILVGLACAHPNYFARPSIMQVVDILSSKAPPPMLPLEMPVSTYITALEDSNVASSASISYRTSVSNEA